MTDDQKRTSQLIASWTQVIAVLIGVGTILVQMGRKEQQLITTSQQVRELSEIVTDLAKAQVGFTINDRNMEDRLRELAGRLDRLERSRT